MLQELCFLSPVSLLKRYAKLVFFHESLLTPDSTLSAFFVLLGMAIYTGVTVHFLGRRFGDWRFSWSYILGWVAMLMTFFAGKQKPGITMITVQARYKIKEHETFHLLQVFSTYVPTESVNAGEETAHVR